MDSETLSFEDLATWARGRWLAGQHEQADKLLERARNLVAKTSPGRTVIRNSITGELSIEGEAKSLSTGDPADEFRNREDTINEGDEDLDREGQVEDEDYSDFDTQDEEETEQIRKESPEPKTGKGKHFTGGKKR